MLKQEVSELRQIIIDAQIALEDSQRVIRSYNWGVKKMGQEISNIRFEKKKKKGERNYE